MNYYIMIILGIISIIILIFSIFSITLNGKQGDKGNKGDTGDKGPIGPNGDWSGTKGDKGPQGKQGPKGIQGIRGNIGTGSYISEIYTGNMINQKDPKWYYDNYKGKILYELIDKQYYDIGNQGYATLFTYLPWHGVEYNEIIQIYYGSNNSNNNINIKTRIGKRDYTWTNWKTIK